MPLFSYCPLISLLICHAAAAAIATLLRYADAAACQDARAAAYVDLRH